jgi:Zn-dependent protease with chaperone function
MFGSVVRALIYLCFMALAYYLVIWVLGELGIMIPAMVMHIIIVIFVLIAILVLYQLLWPRFREFDWWGRGPPGP